MASVFLRITRGESLLTILAQAQSPGERLWRNSWDPLPDGT